MGWIGCVPCKKSKRDNVARTFALIAPVQYVLQQVSGSYEIIPNAPKYYETDRNISSGPSGVDGVRWLRKITMRLRGTNFCTSAARFAPSFVRQPNGLECTEMVRNALKCHFRVQWSGSGAFVAKNSDVTSWHEHLH